MQECAPFFVCWECLRWVEIGVGKGFGVGGESGRERAEMCAFFVCQIVNGKIVQGAEKYGYH